MDAKQEKQTTVGRPRSEKAREAIIKATLNFLKENSYSQLTMERIAKEAGVGKPTLYRWWPGVPFIVMESLKLQVQSEISCPDTGELERDVHQYLKETFRSLTEGADDVVRNLMAEAQFNPDFAVVFRESFISSRRQTLIRILERGVKRGELPPNADLELIADLCYGPMWYRLLNRHATLEEPFARSLVLYLFS